MYLHRFKFIFTTFVLFTLFCYSAFGWAAEETAIKGSFYEVSAPPDFIKNANQASSNLNANSFDFNDGTLQGWYTAGVYDEDGDGPFASHFSQSWADAVSYPTSGLADPIGNNNGSYKICNVMGHGITNPTATYWYVYWLSPDLSSSATWQNADGYSIKLLNYMDLIGAVPGTHLNLYINCLVTIYDNDAGENRYFRSYLYDQEIETWAENPSWIHLDMDWSGIYSSIPNYTIKDVYISVKGRMSDYFEGGIYLDEVVPFTNINTEPQISYQPNEFNVSLQQGDSGTEQLTIRNTGNANLTYNLSTISAMGLRGETSRTSDTSDPDLFAPSVKPNAAKVMITGWGKLNAGNSVYDVMTYISSLGFDVDSSRNFPGSLSGIDVLILVGGGSADIEVPENIIDNFVYNGKGLIIFEGAVYSTDFDVSANSNPVQSFTGWDYRTNPTVINPSNPLTVGLPASASCKGYSTNAVMKPGANVAMQWSDGVVFAATYEYGAGKVAYFNHLNAWYGYFWNGDEANGRILTENALNYVLTSDIGWLSLSETSGTLTPGNSRDIDVNFDASGLAVNTYTAGIEIRSNDPTYSLIQIPVAMEVTSGGAPVLHVSPTTLNFANITNSLTFQISNTGSGTLSWTVTENPEKSWITSVSPGSGTNAATVTVTVDRTTISSFYETGTLSVTSNGGNQNVAVTIEKELQLPWQWHYTANTGNSAVVVLPTTANPNIDGTPLQTNDFIGVFTPAGLCCGWKQWEGANLSITVWGDDDQSSAVDGFQPGQQLHFRVYRLSEDTEWEHVQVAYSQGNGNYAANAFMVLSQFDVTATSCINLSMHAGWNMFSINVYPDNPDLNVVMNPVLSDIMIIKNGAGQTFIPQYSINDIGDIQFDEGYQAYCQQAVTVEVCGQPIPAVTPIPLNAGWSLISYLIPAPVDISAALSTINSQLVIAKNNSGQTYIPMYGINDIGDMQPGQGYQVYLNAAATLIYPAATAELAEKEQPTGLRKTQTEHFTFTEGTGDNATVVITTTANPRFSDGTPLESGDEIAAFTTDGLCCGAVEWQGANKALTVWGNDNQTAEQDGFVAGDTLRFRVWKKSTDTEHAAHVTFQTGQPVTYTSNGFSVLTDLIADAESNIDIATAENPLAPSKNQLLQNYPNPFNPDTHIPYQLSRPARVILTIYDLNGRQIRTLINEEKSAGHYTATWNATDATGEKVSSGIYLYRLQVDGDVFSHKMILLK